MKIVELPIDAIKVKEDRYRKDFGDIESLAESIKSLGQLVPIMVTSDYTLIAGERRLRACKLAGIPTIKATIVDADDIRAKIIEITENIERKDFTWQERARATKELHQMLERLHGGSGDWSYRKTAEEAGLSVGKVSIDLNLAQALDENPEIFDGCKTRDQALKVLQKHKVDEAMTELMLRKSQKALMAKAAELLFLGDCVELCDTLPDKSIDAVITDPPYGIDIDEIRKSPTKEDLYEDRPDIYLKTIEALIKKLDRVMKDDSVIVMFCGARYLNTLKSLLESIGFTVPHNYAYWVRPSGQTNHPNRALASCCETFVYGTRGNASIQKQGRPNVFSCPGVTPADKIHPVQKPFDLMMEIVETFTLPGYTVLDPFAGGATTILAALKKGCLPIGFELDEQYYLAALDRLSRAIALKDGGMADKIGDESVCL